MIITKEILAEIRNRTKGIFPGKEVSYKDWEDCILGANNIFKEGECVQPKFHIGQEVYWVDLMSKDEDTTVRKGRISAITYNALSVQYHLALHGYPVYESHLGLSAEEAIDRWYECKKAFLNNEVARLRQTFKP